MGLYRLIYASTVKDLDHARLKTVIESSAEENARRYLTGMLLMDNGYFVQLLEGERAAVSERFIDIAAETHHDGIEILVCGPIDARLFSDWGAQYIGSQGKAARVLKRYQGGPAFNPYKLTSGNAESLCVDLSTETTPNNVTR